MERVDFLSSSICLIGPRKEIFKLVRKKNALCIVDEVQTGFGRVGNYFWGFQEHEVILDQSYFSHTLLNIPIYLVLNLIIHNKLLLLLFHEKEFLLKFQ